MDKKDNDLKYLLEADVYYKSKKYKEAITTLQKAIDINPRNDSAYKNMAIAYGDLKKYKQAKPH